MTVTIPNTSENTRNGMHQWQKCLNSTVVAIFILLVGITGCNKTNNASGSYQSPNVISETMAKVVHP